MVEQGLLVAVLSVAAIRDIREMKIPNYLIGIGYFGILILKLLQGNPSLLIQFFLGSLVPIAILFILQVFGMLGAGDIKLFALIGASVGPREILIVLAFSFVIGAVISLITMIVRGNFFIRMHFFTEWLGFSWRTKQIVPYYLEGEGPNGLICFSTSILLGFLAYWGYYFVKIYFGLM